MGYILEHVWQLTLGLRAGDSSGGGKTNCRWQTHVKKPLGLNLHTFIFCPDNVGECSSSNVKNMLTFGHGEVSQDNLKFHLLMKDKKM